MAAVVERTIRSLEHKLFFHIGDYTYKYFQMLPRFAMILSPWKGLLDLFETRNCKKMSHFQSILHCKPLLVYRKSICKKRNVRIFKYELPPDGFISHTLGKTISKNLQLLLKNG